MILEINADSGKVVISAAKIDLATIDKSMLVKPNKGKKVTKAEYEK